MKIWCIYTVEYNSAVKNNEIMKSVGKWGELEKVELTEVGQTQKDKRHTISH